MLGMPIPLAEWCETKVAQRCEPRLHADTRQVTSVGALVRSRSSV